MKYRNIKGVEVETAHSVEIHFCHDEDCERAHVVLLNAENVPIGEFVCPDASENGGGFAARLHHYACRAAIHHGKMPDETMR